MLPVTFIVVLMILQVVVGASLIRLAAQLLYKADVPYRRAFGAFLVVFVLMNLGFWMPLAINQWYTGSTIAATRTSSGTANPNAQIARSKRQLNPRNSASSKRLTTPLSNLPQPSLKPSLMGLAVSFLLSSIVVGRALELGFMSGVVTLGLAYVLLVGISLVFAIPFC